VPSQCLITRPDPQPKSRTRENDSIGRPASISALRNAAENSFPDRRNHSTSRVPVELKISESGGIGIALFLRATRFLLIVAGVQVLSVRHRKKAGGSRPSFVMCLRSMLCNCVMSSQDQGLTPIALCFGFVVELA
jgi:hypothetical protein